MRYGKKAPDVSDLLPTVRKRGVIQTLLVRPSCQDGDFEIVAGARRYHAARIVAQETGEAEPLPCRILSQTDDASAIEASMIENLARLDADEVTQWETFTRLVKEGRNVADVAATFGLPQLTITRVLALGNLLPRIRSLYASEKIDRAMQAGKELTGELDKPFVETRVGDAIEGRLARQVELVSGRYALVERAKDFTLVPWRTELDNKIGKTASGILRVDGVSWRFGKFRSGPEIT